MAKPAKKRPAHDKANRKILRSRDAIYEPRGTHPVGGRPGVRGSEETLKRQINIAALLGAGLPEREVAFRLGYARATVQHVKAKMQSGMPRAEVLRKAAQEARERVMGKALSVLDLAIGKAETQIKKGVKNHKGEVSEPPLAHVAQTIRSLGDIAMHQPTEAEKPQDSHPGDRVHLTSQQMMELLLKVRDHEQARGRALPEPATETVDVTPTKEKTA